MKVILITAAAVGLLSLSCTIASAAPYQQLQPSVQSYVHKAHYGHAYRHARRHGRHYRRWH